MEYKVLDLEDYDPADLENALNNLSKKGYRIVLCNGSLLILVKSENPSERL